MDNVEVFEYTWRYWDHQSDQELEGNSFENKILVTKEEFKIRAEKGQRHGAKDYQLGRSWNVPSSKVVDGVYHPELPRGGFQSNVERDPPPF